MNCTGVASANCTQAGSIQAMPKRLPSIGSNSGSDNTMPAATGAKPAHGERSCGDGSSAARGS